MAKLRVPVSTLTNYLPRGAAYKAIAIDGGDIVFDVSGDKVPDVEEVVMTEVQEITTVTWTVQGFKPSGEGKD